MYHAQTPPPQMVDNAKVSGITWVDLVFPFFLFAMGAAIPLVYGHKRDDKQENRIEIVLAILKRGALLFAFSIISQHLRPGSLSAKPDQTIYAWALLFFVGTLLLFIRLPVRRKWIEWVCWIAGGLIVAYGLFGWKYPGGKGFDPARQDVILMVLSQVSVTASLAWLATRKSALARILVLGIMLELIFIRDHPGPIRDYVWNWTPAPWLYRFEFQKYLVVVLSGTFLGEIIAIRNGPERPSFSGFQQAATLFFAGIGIVTTVIGLLDRAVFEAGMVAFLCGIGGFAITRNDPERNIVWNWGFALLMLGFLAEPYGGGIRKDPATVSYYLVTSGLAFWAYAAISNFRTLLRRTEKRGFLASVGANPLLAYACITNLVFAGIRVTGLWDWVGNQNWEPWPLVGAAFCQTLMVGIVCAIATKLRVFLRA